MDSASRSLVRKVARKLDSESFYSFSTSSGFPLATEGSHLLWIALSARKNLK